MKENELETCRLQTGGHFVQASSHLKMGHQMISSTDVRLSFEMSCKDLTTDMTMCTYILQYNRPSNGCRRLGHATIKLFLISCQNRSGYVVRGNESIQMVWEKLK